jgi:hypothetical protein
MNNSRRNETREREMSIQISADDLEKRLIDRRNNFELGTVQQVCTQFGISIKRQGRKAILTARRDGMQIMVEKLHFCVVKYSIVR